MPLYKVIDINATTQILVWNITETYEDLFDEVALTDVNLIRLHTMKSQLHQRAFLSVRKILQQINLTDFDLYYDLSGKPHLKNEKFISITHSFQFSAIIISDQKVGIDIEKQREKITLIANKFCDYEFNFLKKENLKEYIYKLTIIWGAKESIFKIRNEKGISFKKHIKVISFDLKEKKGRAWLHFDNVIEDFQMHFEAFENFILVYVFEN